MSRHKQDRNVSFEGSEISLYFAIEICALNVYVGCVA